jgi:hypothetical protein
MGRRLPDQIRILALIAALVLVHGCKEREQLEKEAPALAHADFKVDRIAIAGVVSDVAALGDSAESRESWSLLIGDHLGRDRFGKLPIVSYSEVRAILGRSDHGVMLDRFKDDGGCDDGVLAELKTVLGGKARFIVFGNIQADRIEWSESENEVVDKKTKTTTKTKTMTTSRRRSDAAPTRPRAPARVLSGPAWSLRSNGGAVSPGPAETLAMDMAKGVGQGRPPSRQASGIVATTTES